MAQTNDNPSIMPKDEPSTESAAPNVQPKLADVVFPEPPEDPKEQPRSLKKKSGERGHVRRDRDSSSSGEAVRNSSHRCFVFLSF